MHCPFCTETDTKVIVETAELVMPRVIKSNGNREPFNEDKMQTISSVQPITSNPNFAQPGSVR